MPCINYYSVARFIGICVSADPACSRGSASEKTLQAARGKQVGARSKSKQQRKERTSCKNKQRQRGKKKVRCKSRKQASKQKQWATEKRKGNAKENQEHKSGARRKKASKPQAQAAAG